MREASDWWIHGSLPLALLDLSLFLTLQARPGRIAPLLWKVGPPLVVIAAAVLLSAALMSSLRTRSTWNPRRAAGLAVLFLTVISAGAYRTYPSSHDNTPSVVDFRLPLEGPVKVAWGGPTAKVNYHVSDPAERWAYDLLVTVDGLTHPDGATALTDYYAYDRLVHAPAAGRVVDVHDGDPDPPPGRPDRGRRGGNSIVLEVAPGQYLFILHLKPHTIRVAVGQEVRQDQIVGTVGNSGNSSEPHVHLHLQDTPAPGLGEGIPFAFSNYMVLDDGRTMRRGMPEGGVRRGRYVGEVIARAAE